MADQAKNILIGLFVIAACALAVFILLFVHPKTGDEGARLRVRFIDIDKVNVGTRVTFAGRPVGEVIEIIDADDPRNPRESHKGKVYPYELTLVMDSSIEVYNTDEVYLRTSGLLGEKTVAIVPMPPKPNQPLRLITDEILYAYEVGSVEDTMRDLKLVGDKLEEALGAITVAFEAMNEEKLWEKTARMVENIRSITASLNKPKQLSESVDEIHKLIKNVNETWKKSDQFVDNLIAASDHVKQLTADTAKGKGTLGRLLATEDFYLRTTSVMSKMETLMDDINHYGILFHLDKGWQRIRARRMNLLHRLSTPQEFRNFFSDEVNQITTSLARVSQVMEKTNAQCPGSELLADPEFEKVFAELLRRVDGLEQSMKLYNTQLVEESGK
ncbi:MAG: MCE family protein [Chlamydiia bacterium]|nr:MCE family protein [Chlamydiia bacterium]